MIDQKAMTLSDVARRLPGRSGAHCNPSTVARWVHKGVVVNGVVVKLAATRLGHTLFVTEDSLAEFLIALNGPAAAPVAGIEAIFARSPAARSKSAGAAVRKLTAMGV